MLKSYVPTPKGKEEIELFKTKFSKAANVLASMLDDGRSKSLFLTKMEEASMWGVVSLCEKEDNHGNVLTYDEKGPSVEKEQAKTIIKLEKEIASLTKQVENLKQRK